jgi:polyhydroxyalkanoate synthesis repressor PhaR
MSEPARVEPAVKTAEALPVVVKKYANRRLYNTESSSYITLDNLAELVRQGRDFVVYDAKTSEDITRGVLTQIIVEEEGKGKAMLPTAFLRQLIGFYGDSVQGLVPRYLEQALAAFGHQQEQMRAAMQKSMGNFFAFGNMEEVGRQNMAMMERALSLFTPFYRPGEGLPGNEASSGQAAGFDPAQDVAALRAEIEVLRHQLAEARGAQPPVPATEATSPTGATVTRKTPRT